MADEFDDLFRSGASVWLKIGGAALAMMVFGVIGFTRSKRRGGFGEGIEDPAMIAITIAGLTVAGALIGGLLAMKDIVQERKANGQAISWPMRMIFDIGILNVLFFWVPLAFVCITLILIVVL